MAYVVADDRWLIRLQAEVPPWVERLAYLIAADARRLVPIDTRELHDSITVHRVEFDEMFIVVGTDHWAPTEYGSGPHWIISHGLWLRPENPWPLRNARTGQVFGLVVWHPGTPEQPYMRPALHKRRKLPGAGR